MDKVPTWAWYSGKSTWPGFKLDSQDNAQTGKTVSLIGKDSYVPIIWRDGNHDGLISDSDRDDNSSNIEKSHHGPQWEDYVTVGGQNRVVHEIARYVDSRVVIDDKTIKTTVDAFIFRDGTYILRFPDSAIPHGVRPDDIGKVTLGEHNGTEYDAAYIDRRDDDFVCFAGETMIDTADGPRRADSLRAGDMVLTLDGGAMPLRWVGSRNVNGRGDMAPVVIKAGAMGNTADVRVSQQHRVLMSGWKPELVTGTPEVLVAARHLVNGDTVRLEPCDMVTWVHILFDTHQVVRSHGMWTESFHPGAVGGTMLDARQRAELFAIFPELRDGFENYGPAARLSVSAWEARALAA